MHEKPENTYMYNHAKTKTFLNHPVTTQPFYPSVTTPIYFYSVTTNPHYKTCYTTIITMHHHSCAITY